MVLNARLTVCAMLVLTALLPLTMLPQSRGASVDLFVGRDSVTMNLRLDLQENLTALPQVDLYLDTSNSTPALQPIARAVQRLVPSASIDSLRLRARTSLLSTATQMWLLQENYTIVVSGTNANPGSQVRSNVAFASMNASDPISTGNVELNAVGRDYLLDHLNALPSSGTAYFINQHQTLNAIIPGQTTLGFYLLDFTWVAPVSTWNRQDDILRRSTVWTLDPPGPRYNLTVGVGITPENTFRAIYTAVFNPSLDLTVSANAWAEGTTVFFDLPTQAEFLMPGIIGVSVAMLLASTFLEWKLARPRRAKRKK